MEPLSGPIDPMADWVTLWGFRVILGALFVCLFVYLFRMTLSKEELEKEITGDDEKEED